MRLLEPEYLMKLSVDTLMHLLKHSDLSIMCNLAHEYKYACLSIIYETHSTRILMKWSLCAVGASFWL